MTEPSFPKDHAFSPQLPHVVDEKNTGVVGGENGVTKPSQPSQEPTKLPSQRVKEKESREDKDDDDHERGGEEKEEGASDVSESTGKTRLRKSHSRPKSHNKIAAKPSDAKSSPDKRRESDADADGRGSTKKPAFERVWSPEDEISLLRAGIQFSVEKGLDISSDYSTFYEFLRRSSNVQMTLSQVSEKIRRLRRHYFNKIRKGKRQPSYKTNDHNILIYQLSQKIWGANNKEEEMDENLQQAESRDLDLFIRSLISHGVVRDLRLRVKEVKRVLQCMPRSRAKEWQGRWMNIWRREKDVRMDRAELGSLLMQEYEDLMEEYYDSME